MKLVLTLLVALVVAVPTFSQTNCSNIIYVTPSGNPLGTGTTGDPVTLARALNLVTPTKNHVRVLNGVYTYAQKFVLPSNAVIDGAYQIVGGEWVKNSSLTTIFNVTTSVEVQTGAGHFIAFQLNGVTNVYIKDVEINNVTPATGTTSSRGNSAYGVHVANTTNFYITRTRVTSSNAAAGAAGTAGAVGGAGAAGRQGNDADYDGSGCLSVGFNDGRGGQGSTNPTVPGGNPCAPCNGNCTSPTGVIGTLRQGGNGGYGGAGGFQDDPNIDGRPGSAGGVSGGSVGAGGAGGNSNSGSCSIGNGVNGGAGGAGANGANAVGTGPAGTFGLFYVPGAQAANGADGLGGSGGGGGGGGGGQADDSSGFFGCVVNDGSGAQGGGGGGGGQGGQGGQGGFGGGGTFAVYAQTGNTGAYLHSLATTVGTAGTGGAGGTGGTGGAGGAGAAGGGNTNGGEVGFGGIGGNGGNGGNGGSGAAGAAGSAVQVQGATVTGTTIPNPVTLTANMFGGCTNSEIIITKASGTFTLQPGSAFINDLSNAASSYNTASASAILSYTTTGHKDLVVNGTNYEYFVYIKDTRALPTFAASMPATVCEGNTFNMSTPTTGSQYEWVIFPASGSTAVPTAVYTTSVASWTTPVTGTSMNYSVRLRTKDDCCGWSAPVYFNFAVVAGGAAPLASGVTICENNTAALTATGSGVGNLTWYSDPLGQNSLQSTAGAVSNYTTNVLSNNTVYYVGEGIGTCSGALTAVPVTVNSAPADPTPNTVAVCSGQNAVMSASGAGGTYSWYNVASGGAALSTGVTYNAGTLAAGTYTYYLSESNGTCSSNRVPVSVMVNSNPAAPTVLPVTICNNTSTSLSATAAGSVRWYSDAALTNLIGTGSTYTTPVLSANTTYFVTQSNANGCNSVSSSLPVTVTGTVMPTLAVSASATAICSGNTVNFTATPSNGGATPTYNWFVNGVSQAVNAPTFSSSTLNNNDVVTAQLTSSATCASPVSTNSNNIVITVTSSATPTIAITSSSTTICEGTQVTFSANTAYGGNTPNIQWQVNGSPVGTNNNVYTNSTLGSGDIVSAVLTSSGSCVTTATANSNNISITVNTNVTPALSIAASASTICAGASATFTATPTNGGATPAYEWYVNGIAQGVNNAVFTTSSLNSSDMVFARMTSSAGCTNNGGIATSNTILMTVNPVVTPTAFIASSSATICAGSAVTFNASTTNGGGAPTYQWMLNGAPVGANSNVYTSSTLANGDLVSMTLTTSAACATTPTANSNNIVISVNPVVVPGLSIAASSNSICAGASVTFTATPTNAGATPTYSWYVNGISQGVNATTFTSTTLNQLDVVAAQMVSSANCAQPSTVSSNSVVMTVNPVTTPTIAISTSATTVCSGTPVVFSAAISNGGVSPVVQWSVNGTPVGSNSTTFSSTTLNNGDVVQATLTSSASCVTTASATSNTITMVVNSNVVPSVSIAASANSICAGTSITFTATPTNGGTTPVYDWTVNGVSQGVNATTFTSSTLTNNDVVSVQLQSNAPCANPSVVTSNSIVVIVKASSTPTISISASQNPICAGDPVTFFAAIDDNGAVPTVDWTVNGVSVSSNPIVFTSNSLANGDVITATVTSNAACPTVASVTATPITISVSTSLTPAISIVASSNNICAGTSVSFTANAINGGATPMYDWMINGVSQGFNGTNFTSTTLNQGDVVSAQLTSSASCATIPTVSSNSIFMTVNPVLTPTISISASATAICANESVNFFATVSNAGSSPVIQWNLNGNPVGTNNTVLTLSGLLSSDVVSATVTSSAACTTAPTANSNSISLTVSNSVTPMAFISTPSVIFCPGSSVTFTSNITNGGATPTYNWYLNGVSTGITTASYTNATPANGDVVMLVLTSSSACSSIPTVSSNSITLFSSTSAVASIGISSLTGSLCEGDLINFIAIPLNATGTLSYQWQVNGTSAGLNNNVFSSSPLVAGDAVTVVLSYQDACGTSLTATSNTLTVVPKPVVSAGPDVSIQNGIPVVLNGSTSIPGTILWSPAGTLSSAVILNPTASPTVTTDYLLTVQTANGCTGTDMVTVAVQDSVTGIFNSFTPNGDGMNDVWNIPNASAYPEISVQIFNRWGNLIYEQENSYVPWDGKHKGEELPSDTYFYIIKWTPSAEALKGPVTLVR